MTTTDPRDRLATEQPAAPSAEVLAVRIELELAARAHTSHGAPRADGDDRPADRRA